MWLVAIALLGLRCSSGSDTPRQVDRSAGSPAGEPTNVRQSAVKTVFVTAAPVKDEHKREPVHDEDDARRLLNPFFQFIKAHYNRPPKHVLRADPPALLYEIEKRRPDFVLLYSPVRSYVAEKLGYRTIHPSSNYYRALMFAQDQVGQPRSLPELVELAKERQLRVGYRPASTSSCLVPLAALASAGIPRDRVTLVKASKKDDLLSDVVSGQVDVAALEHTIYDRKEFEGDSSIRKLRIIWTSALLPSGAFMVHNSLLKRAPLIHEDKGDAQSRLTQLRADFADLFVGEMRQRLRDVNVFSPTQQRSYSAVLDPLFEHLSRWEGDTRDSCQITTWKSDSVPKVK
jgi:hypothetical protein